MSFNIEFVNKVSKDSYGKCRAEDRNYSSYIKIFQNSPDHNKTLIHELIHDFLFKKIKKGYKARQLSQINDDENIIDGLAIHIKEGLIEAGVIK